MGVLGASWAILKPPWAVLERSWVVSGPSWTVLVPSLNPLGPSCGCLASEKVVRHTTLNTNTGMRAKAEVGDEAEYEPTLTLKLKPTAKRYIPIDDKVNISYKVASDLRSG